jgi:hypothetical protein
VQAHSTGASISTHGHEQNHHSLLPCLAGCCGILGRRVAQVVRLCLRANSCWTRRSTGNSARAAPASLSRFGRRRRCRTWRHARGARQTGLGLWCWVWSGRDKLRLRLRFPLHLGLGVGLWWQELFRRSLRFWCRLGLGRCCDLHLRLRRFHEHHLNSLAIGHRKFRRRVQHSPPAIEHPRVQSSGSEKADRVGIRARAHFFGFVSNATLLMPDRRTSSSTAIVTPS